MEKAHINDAIQFNDTRFTKIDMIKTKDSVAFMLGFLPGQTMKQHGHPGKEIYLHLLEGAGTFHVDDKDIEVTVGDLIYCSESEQLGFTNSSEKNVSIYVTMNKISE